MSGALPDPQEAIPQVDASSYMNAPSLKGVGLYPHKTRSGTSDRSIVAQAMNKSAAVS